MLSDSKPKIYITSFPFSGVVKFMKGDRGCRHKTIREQEEVVYVREYV